MAPPAHADRSYLEQHGNQWRVVVNVPRALRGKFGTKLKVSLGTDSLREANRVKWSVIDRLKTRLSETEGAGLSKDRILQEAMTYAQRRLAALDLDAQQALDEDAGDYAEELAGPPVGVDENGHAVYDPHRDDLAMTFLAVARGEQTPIKLLHEQYRRTLQVKARTLADDERAVGYLVEWCDLSKLPPFVQTLSKRHAGRFADEGLRATAGDLNPVTLNKYLRRLSKFWDWLEKRDHVQVNIWRGQTLPEPRMTDETRERPFTAEEMTKLLSGPATPEMHDLMRIAALTGARIDPIVCLRVKDCADGTFSFRPQKAEPGRRLVPIHPALKEIVGRRTDGRAPDDDLFPEWPPVKKEGSVRERSFKTSNHFTEYRRSVGVDDRVEGNRRSRVNFHSFRRWFATEAERADQPGSIIAAVMGHKRDGMTLGLYSAGPKLEQARRCVEAIRLPV